MIFIYFLSTFNTTVLIYKIKSKSRRNETCLKIQLFKLLTFQTLSNKPFKKSSNNRRQ